MLIIRRGGGCHPPLRDLLRSLFSVLQSVLSVPGDIALARVDSSLYINAMTIRRLTVPILIIVLSVFIAAAAPTPTPFPERDLHTVTDDFGVITAELPGAWTDIRTERWLDNKGKPIGVTLLAAFNIEDFQDLKGEGVAISVSDRLGKGYIQLLDEETKFYEKFCDDTYKTAWTVEHPLYRGRYMVLDCDPLDSYAWLSVMSMVNKKDPAAYVARVVGLDEIPIFGDEFRDVVTGFTVEPENLPD